MAETSVPEIALRELKNTVSLAEEYLTRNDPDPDIIRDHGKDISEDIATLEKQKTLAPLKDRPEEVAEAIALAKAVKRKADKIARQIEVEGQKREKEEERIARVRQNDPVKAPRVQIPTFDGESSGDYRGFIAAFRASIGHEQGTDPVKLWLLLRAQLSGKALDLVRELPIAPETYQIAVKILESNFGGDRAAILELYQRLQTLPNATLQTDSLKITHSRMEGILLSLKHLGVEAGNDDFLRAVALSKYPSELTHILRITNQTSLDEFRKLLAEYIASLNCTIQQVISTVVGTAQAVPAATKAVPTSNFKGGAEGFRRQRHGAAQTSGTGGTGTGPVPPEQVTNQNSSYLRQRKKLNGRMYKCIFCRGSHWSDECDVHKTLEARVKLVADRCQRCFRQPHTEKPECENWNGCCHCQSREHNRAICPVKLNKVGHMFVTEEKSQSSQSRKPVSEFITAMITTGDVDNSKQITVRTILDTGGGRSLVTRDLITELELTPTIESTVRLVTANKVPLTKGPERVQKLLVFPPGYEPVEITAHVVDEIADEAHGVDVSELKKRYPRYADLKIPPEGNGERVRLLLGYRSLQPLVTLQSSLFVEPGLQLMSTLFGWVPFGRLPGSDDNQQGSSSVLLIREVDPVKLMCDLDTIGLAEFQRTENEEEETALKRFNDTIKKVDGRYQVEWPWKYEDPDLKDNFGLAWGRLQSLHKQLSSKPDILSAYDRLIHEQLQAGIVETVDEKSTPSNNRKHYLAHRAVIRIGKSTPVRMVFDASARCGKYARSLNDNILKGSNWVTELPAVLMRFRKNAVAIISDIEKAFHQIGIAPRDRDVVRFIWLRDPLKPPTSDNLLIYRFKRVAFGVIASPFLLSATIKNHLRTYPKDLAEKIESDLYADNLVISLPRDIVSEDFYKNTKSCFADMSMNISKWVTNNQDLMKKFAKNDRLEENPTSVLGLTWNTKTDLLGIKSPRIPNTSSAAVTKRSALREMATVYDPLGFVLPIVLAARIFIRRLWKENFKWDEPIPAEMGKEWVGIRDQLNRVEEVKLPRLYGAIEPEEAIEIQLHTFCDASHDAYGVVVYLLLKTSDRSYQTLVAAKSRLAPKSDLSTPRLELLAALIGTRFTNYVEKSLKIKKQLSKFLWGDSKCVIAWTTSKKLLPAFIEKSTKEIRSSGIQQFSYVPTDQNPADVTSRGATIEQLNEQKWWNGPEWLSDVANWPNQQTLYNRKTEALEERTMQELHIEEEKILFIRTIIRLKNNVDPNSNENAPFNINPKDYSTLARLLRQTVVCGEVIQRFRKNMQNTFDAATLNHQWARRVWIRWDQQRIYEPIKNKQNTNVSYLRNLRVSADEHGLIRCETRLKWAKLSRKEAEPILLVKRSLITRLIILQIHENNLHAGTAHTLAALRKQYWLPHGRREVYKTIKDHCYTCRRFNAQPYKHPEMAPLPPFRVQRTSKPFANAGLDVFGPYQIRANDSSTKKIWVVIFTCLVTRAVHLELLHNMTAEQFLLAFRRFVGRRGTPEKVVSDNAPHFEVVDGLIRNLWQHLANEPTNARYYAQKEINWHFIPASAPWMGGVYERLIHIVKTTFDKVYGGRILDDEQFGVAVIEVEAMVNSRPITYVGKEREAEVITPADFLGVRYPAIPVDPEQNLNITTKELSRAWRSSEQYLNEFWRIWSEQYLRAVRERRDHMHSGQKDDPSVPRVGEIVLLVDSAAKRSSWVLAVVERRITDEDGKIRAVQIKSADRARLIRPIVKLAPLKLLMDLPDTSTDLNANAKTITVDDTPGYVEI